MKSAFVVLFCVFGLLVPTFGDVYMHNPRGSNNRNREANDNRNNANRLFDSQNNGKGGYCWGPKMSYYEGSLLQIVWTNQHGCGHGMVCNQVIQYMCSASNAAPAALVRDGTTTDTIPDNDNGPTDQSGTDGSFTFGMHEPRSNYVACKTRQRNMGLWISDREKEGNLTPGRASAIFTRQNNNGNRHGYECAEERDYYPYWHPSPWKDIAVLVSDESHCDTYRSESQNKVSKNHCLKEDGTPAQQNNEVACAQAKLNWASVDSHGIGGPACVAAQNNRQNHLGVNVNGKKTQFNWTISADEDCAADDNCNCVLRLRYNISTFDVHPDGSLGDPGKPNPDWKQNAEASLVKEDPTVTIDGQPLTLAIDTSQFGRTFEDRSHVWGIRKRPSDVGSLRKIYNVNVQGKRGNIVQAYPSVEYDYVPNELNVYQGDYLHFQWTGCDTNPNGNAGEGRAGTDRSNIVQAEGPQFNTPASDEWLSNNAKLFPSAETRKRMAYLDQAVDDPNVCNPATNNDQDPKNCKVLNAASAYFDGGLQTAGGDGTYYFISSRNNNFSNRDQKGSITVSLVLSKWAIGIVATGGALFVGAAGVGAAMFYANSHPHSQVATLFSKL